jgi:hypothetical protein
VLLHRAPEILPDRSTSASTAPSTAGSWHAGPLSMPSSAWRRCLGWC